MQQDRRSFIKFVVTGSIAAGCPIDQALHAEPAAPLVDGEHNEICHQVRDDHHFPPPASTARHDIVIIGGGMSGLYTAWLLRGEDFLLLEKENHYGGNAYLEEYDGQAFTTGTAYANTSGAAWELCRKHAWRDGLDHLPYPKTVRESFRRFRDDMLKIDLRKRALELDAMPLTALLKDYAPELKAWWDCYGPSNWGADAANTSGAVGLGDFQEFAGEEPDDRATFPGGLGAISRKLAELLRQTHGDRLLSGATTIAVAQSQRDVTVTYVQGGQVKAVTAKAVIMAAPKFIARRLVAGLPPAQDDAMRKLRYAPYPVVNVIFSKPVFNGGYDNWCPGNTFTDFIVADWVVRNQPGYHQKNNILTFYTPLHESQRAVLLAEDTSRQLAANVLRDFQKLLPGSDVDPVEVRIYRRGHPMFMSAPNVYTKLIPAARRPFGRIFFANTDSTGPVSTTPGAIEASQRAVEEMKKRLDTSSRRAS
jgi:monoamine oxidase